MTDAPTPAPAAAPAGGDEPPIKYFFVRRRVFAAVISIVITLLGVFALRSLPINRYPLLTPPSITVTASYPGATAEVVAQAVAAPIEQQLSGLNGLLYYKSANASDGSMQLQVYFDISRDQDLAAVDVQTAVNLATPQLPQEVQRNGITVQKAQTDILLVGALTSSDPRYDAAYLNNYATIYLADELRRLPGVGQATVFGSSEFSMLMRLDPDRMAQLGLTVSDVQGAVNEQNSTNPAGRLGREPSPPGTTRTLQVTTQGRLETPEQFADIVVRARADGSLVKVKDIGKVVLGSRSYDAVGRLNGRPTALILIYLRNGANALDTKKLFVDRMNELSHNFPAGVRWELPFDTTPFVTASIEEVEHTLIEAMILVTLVVFVFLQNWRATLIPILAVPVSVIGTFLGLSALGFSVNVLTLFGLVLAIGIVVDDAIVVIENVERIMAEEKVTPAVAADRAIQQVGGALVAIVLVLCSVFVPVAFLGGITGLLFKQFAVTIAIAVVLSGVVALTLTPALCAMLLQPSHGEKTTGFFGWFNRVFGSITGRYTKSVGRVVGNPRSFFAIFAVIIVLTVVLFRRVPSGFLPTEDKGYFLIAAQLPDASSLQQTEAVVRQVEQMLKSEPSVRDVVVLAGLDILTTANQTNSATIFINLKSFEDRTDAKQQLDAILQRVNMKLFGIKQTIAFAVNLPEIPGLGTTAGLEMYLQARGQMSTSQFAGLVQQFVADANKLPEIQGVNTSFRADAPQIFVTVDRDAAKSRGVALGDLYSTMQAMLSTLYVNDFNLYGRTYRVQLEADIPFRQTPDDIGRLYVHSGNGTMIPISALTRVDLRSGPALLQRFNSFNAALITGAPRPGKSSGEMYGAVEKLVRDKYEKLGLGYAYSGQSYQERSATGSTGIVYVLGIVLVFLVLAAQYDSWSIPFAVLLGVPFGIFGALLAVFIRGMPNDVYLQVAFITVIGLAAKNAILIVEFATELRRQGHSIVESAVEAARERFRPILMTSFAFILGVLPLLTASGAGKGSRHSLGTGVFFGMLAATVIGVFFVPLFFATLRGFAENGLFGRKATAGSTAVPATAEESH